MTHRSNMRAGLLAVMAAIGIGPFSALLARPSAVSEYQVAIGGSRVYIRIDKATRMGHEHGVVGELSSGSVAFAGSGELVFNMRSFVADTPQARSYVGLEPSFPAGDAKKVNENMRGPDVLDVAQFPTATYKISSMQPLDNQAAGEPGRYQVHGNFTLHGVTRALSFQAKFERNPKRGDIWHLRGAFYVNQTDFGITPYSAVGGLIRIADRLTIWGDLVLKEAK